MTCTATLGIVVMIIVVNLFIWRDFWRSRRQRRADDIRAGLLANEPCAFCGQSGLPVERDWRAPTMEGRWVCQDAVACVGRHRENS